ncbi:hypothetical protein PPTG_00454 [Phytophthora nicotianae INRA-310]|uniref:RxLR effector protein n=2 Tax=Phytophthora nicotianae TaxID=4792 RepID=W2RHD1_PHYN3|nr:hypothetical protein PPTG_00454 [Phytophthora nicotianae INRA-310]ETN23985.1 hypothetical protein PPTG_00454 [Phytophthora nicotianae INRA-310]KUF82965.1 Avh37 [Phytophthora nicotianae]
MKTQTMYENSYDGIDKLRDSTKLNTWALYVGKYNLQKPGYEASMAVTLTAHYGDAAVAKLIQAASKVPQTEAVTTVLRKKQLSAWLAAEKSPNEVFRRLKLDKGMGNLFANPTMHTMTDYLNVFNFKCSRKHMSLMKTIAESYTDAAVAKAIREAAKDPETKSNALVLMGLQFDEWIIKEIKPAKMLQRVFGGTPTMEEKAIANVYASYYPRAKKHLSELDLV